MDVFLPACAVRGRYGRAVSAGSVGIHCPDAGALAVAHQRAEVQSANVKALGNSYTAQRKMTHEFRGYLFALSDMLANGDTEAAQSYLDELRVRQTERILLVNTHNPIIDAILNQKGYAAKEQDIDLHFEINDLSDVAIPSVDLTVVMSNLLDNAIEACEKLEKQQRRMTVKAIYNKSDNPPTLFFSVENASKPVENFRRPYPHHQARSRVARLRPAECDGYPAQI